MLFGFVATAFGGAVAFCLMAAITVAEIFCFFSIYKILKLKPRLIVFGGVEAVLITAFIITNTIQNNEFARIRRIEQETQIPGVGQEVNLFEYYPFREKSKVAVLDEESTLKFTDKNKLPRLDGATALFPVYSAFVQAVYPEGDYRDQLYSTYLLRSKTGTAYENLISGEVDIIFVAGISDAHNKLAKSKGVALEFTPIGKEAFVFFVNADNPVDSLTSEQVKGIYSGEITNWNEVGGEDVEIFPYQREANSGSQTSMESFMEDTPLMTPPTEYAVEYYMETVIYEVEARHHKNRPNAIGYSFLYFTTEMVESSQIKLLEIDGVPPNRENIENGTYPQTAEFYAVTDKYKSESNTNIKKFIDWILSEQGQSLIEGTGYCSINSE